MTLYFPSKARATLAAAYLEATIGGEFTVKEDRLHVDGERFYIEGTPNDTTEERTTNDHAS